MQNHFQTLRASRWELRLQELPPLPGVALSGSLLPPGRDALLWLCEPCFPSSFCPNLGAIPALANPRRLPSEASYTASAEAPEVFFLAHFPPGVPGRFN